VLVLGGLNLHVISELQTVFLPRVVKQLMFM